MADMANTEPLSNDFEQNYERFLAEAEETGCVWGLEGTEGFALCPSHVNNDLTVMPFWSQPEFAKAHAVDQWSSYNVVPIALEEVLDEWLPGLHEDLILVGVNWNSDLEGDEVEPLDLLMEFEGSE